MHIEMHHPKRIEPATLDQYLEQGWYRMVQSVFTCRFVMMGGDLHSALWTRLDLSDYRFRKSLRKLMRRNARQFEITCEPATLDAESEALFQRYRVNFRGDLSESLQDSLYGNSGRAVYNTWRFSIRDGGRLVALSFFDLGQDSMLSVMGIYDPDYAQHSLGFTTMLLEMSSGMSRSRTAGCRGRTSAKKIFRRPASRRRWRRFSLHWMRSESRTDSGCTPPTGSHRWIIDWICA